MCCQFPSQTPVFTHTFCFLPASPVYIFHVNYWSITAPSHALLSLPIPPPWLSSLAEGEEEMKITLLQRKRNQLAGYCKLVIYGVLDLSAATDIFKHYSKVEMEIRALRNNSVLLAHVQIHRLVMCHNCWHVSKMCL